MPTDRTLAARLRLCGERPPLAEQVARLGLPADAVRVEQQEQDAAAIERLQRRGVLAAAAANAARQRLARRIVRGGRE